MEQQKHKSMNCGIYKIENLINGKVYIGQSICITHRWRAHRKDAYNPKNRCYERPLYRAIRKYGLDNFSFTVIEYCSEDILNEREVYWIKYYNSFEDGYNLTPGGHEPVIIIPSKLYELWDAGYSVGELIEYFQVSHGTITKWLKNHETYSITEAFRRGGYRADAKNKAAQVRAVNGKLVQYDLEGNFIRKWNSIKQIQRELNLSSVGDGISKCLSKEYFSSGGFRWGYEGQALPTKDEIKMRAKGVQLNLEQVREIKELLLQGLSTVKQRKLSAHQDIMLVLLTPANTGKMTGYILFLIIKRKPLTEAEQIEIFLYIKTHPAF